ncbi:MAG: IS3 family transposase [Clostridia bacterium]|nr:IS3 family transposase [Clostridia bacterium]
MTLGRVRQESGYLAMKHFNEERQWSISWMCGKLDISRASYYKWLNRKVPREEQENETIAVLIREYDERFGHILGYRRMTLWINRLNSTNYSRNRIHRIMQKLNIHAVIRKKRPNYVYSKAESVAENILQRNFTASAPNEKWVTDVTELKIPGGNRKLYLSAILDLYDRSVISYVVSRSNNNHLVFDTYAAAIAANPAAKPIFHSDRGFQYTSRQFQLRLNAQGITQSMSRVGRCIDNGPTEGFWGILKAEMFQLFPVTDEESLITAIDGFFRFYNYERYQARFNGKTPMEVRAEALSTEIPEQYPIPVNKRIQKYKARFAA